MNRNLNIAILYSLVWNILCIMEYSIQDTHIKLGVQFAKVGALFFMLGYNVGQAQKSGTN